MLRVGLTGGIGAGKSTVGRHLVQRGAALVDADVIAREVVAPGTPGLAALVAEFGPSVLTADGSLDRPALGRRVFGDADARAALNTIVHPLVAARREELVLAVAPDAVVVEDVPLLVETGQSARFPLVVVVDADVDERLRRLVTERGMTEADARARTAAQASDPERRAAADVLLPNPRRPEGAPDALTALVDTLWDERLVPFEANLRARRGAPRPGSGVLVPHRPEWPGQATRVLRRVAHVAGGRALSLEHVGSTAVPGLAARAVLDVQVVVADPAAAAHLADDLHAAGLVRLPGAGDAGETVVVNADPGLAVTCHVRPADAPVAVQAVTFRDALRADPALRTRYEQLERALAARSASPAAPAVAPSAVVVSVVAAG